MIPYIDYSKCTGCSACAELYPLFFEMRDDRAWFINFEKFIYAEHGNIIYSCPFRAIVIE
ncbi:MAG: ferredoxin [Nitrospirae bacterium]|nr:ferredoxin [Nitrospirota bacterium]